MSMYPGSYLCLHIYMYVYVPRIAPMYTHQLYIYVYVPKESLESSLGTNACLMQPSRLTCTANINHEGRPCDAAIHHHVVAAAVGAIRFYDAMTLAIPLLLVYMLFLAGTYTYICLCVCIYATPWQPARHCTSTRNRNASHEGDNKTHTQK